MIQTARTCYLDAIQIIYNLALHAAGLYRTKERVTKDGYLYMTSSSNHRHTLFPSIPAGLSQLNKSSLLLPKMLANETIIN